MNCHTDENLSSLVCSLLLEILEGVNRADEAQEENFNHLKQILLDKKYDDLVNNDDINSFLRSYFPPDTENVEDISSIKTGGIYTPPYQDRNEYPPLFSTINYVVQDSDYVFDEKSKNYYFTEIGVRAIRSHVKAILVNEKVNALKNLIEYGVARINPSKIKLNVPFDIKSIEPTRASDLITKVFPCMNIRIALPEHEKANIDRSGGLALIEIECQVNRMQL